MKFRKHLILIIAGLQLTLVGCSLPFVNKNNNTTITEQPNISDNNTQQKEIPYEKKEFLSIKKPMKELLNSYIIEKTSIFLDKSGNINEYYKKNTNLTNKVLADNAELKDKVTKIVERYNALIVKLEKEDYPGELYRNILNDYKTIMGVREALESKRPIFKRYLENCENAKNNNTESARDKVLSDLNKQQLEVKTMLAIIEKSLTEIESKVK